MPSDASKERLDDDATSAHNPDRKDADVDGRDPLTPPRPPAGEVVPIRFYLNAVPRLTPTYDMVAGRRPGLLVLCPPSPHGVYPYGHLAKLSSLWISGEQRNSKFTQQNN